MIVTTANMIKSFFISAGKNGCGTTSTRQENPEKSTARSDRIGVTLDKSQAGDVTMQDAEK